MQKVIIAMSGGVDSSVAAALLRDRGFECMGMHLKFWNDPLAPGNKDCTTNKCCTTESLLDARRVAARLKIPFYVSNCEKDFKKYVVDYFLETCAQGATPNPCVQCNNRIKFGFLINKALSMGADFVATGHYAKKVWKNGKWRLCAARDKKKDQSYFLYGLTRKKMDHVLFPLGDLLKSEVYEIAKKKGFENLYKKKESQGLCFFPEPTPKNFLMRHLPQKFFKPGPIVTVDGRVIGEHKGLPLYTIGQRHGMGIGGIAGETQAASWYVVATDRVRNELIVGRENDLFSNSFECKDLNFISGEAPKKPVKIRVRVRYRSRPVSAILKVEKGVGRVRCLAKVKAVCCGQAAVFYRGMRGGEVLGGGVIAKKFYEKKPSQKRRRLSIARRFEARAAKA